MRSLRPSAISWIGIEAMDGLYWKCRERGTETSRRSSNIVRSMREEDALYTISTALNSGLWEPWERAEPYTVTDVGEMTTFCPLRGARMRRIGLSMYEAPCTMVGDATRALNQPTVGPARVSSQADVSGNGELSWYSTLPLASAFVTPLS